MENVIGIVILSILAGLLTIYTITSNLMVIVAFKINRKLHTLNNYCLVSLAVSDLTVGIFLMPMYTVYLFIGYWPLRTILCDIWLSLDYGLCTASVVNLFVIALDRLLSVTKPLTYRRTPRKMGVLIAFAWIVSLLIWPPWIFVWPYIDGKLIVPINECYVQFLVTNSMMTALLSGLSFYTPVILTTILYYILYAKTEKRRLRKKALQSGQASMSDVSEATTSTITSLEFSDSTSCLHGFCHCFGNIKKAAVDSGTFRQTNDDNVVNQGDKEVHSHSATSCETRVTFDSEEPNPDIVQRPTDYIGKTEQETNTSGVFRIASHEVQAIKTMTKTISFQEVSGDFTSAFDTLDAVTQKRVTTKSNRSDSRMAKILSATLLSLIITNGPYYTTALIESFCPGSINLILGGIGE